MEKLPETNENRVRMDKKIGGLTVYRVKLKGGPSDGLWTIVSHDTAYVSGEKYERGENNLYIHEPKAGGRN
jgi:hypothetical protein